MLRCEPGLHSGRRGGGLLWWRGVGPSGELPAVPQWELGQAEEAAHRRACGESDSGRSKLTLGTWATSLIVICQYDLLLWLHLCLCGSNFTLHVLNVNKDSRCVFLGCPAQHRRRVAGLFSRRSITLRVGEPRPQSQPRGDPGALRPLRGNTQTPQEHHQCQVVYFVATRGQPAPSYYTAACSWVHSDGLNLDFTQRGASFSVWSSQGSVLMRESMWARRDPTWSWPSARCSPPQDWVASSRGLSALNIQGWLFPQVFLILVSQRTL